MKKINVYHAEKKRGMIETFQYITESVMWRVQDSYVLVALPTSMVGNYAGR